VKIER
jgi:hypothetical protein